MKVDTTALREAVTTAPVWDSIKDSCLASLSERHVFDHPTISAFRLGVFLGARPLADPHVAMEAYDQWHKLRVHVEEKLGLTDPTEMMHPQRMVHYTET